MRIHMFAVLPLLAAALCAQEPDAPATPGIKLPEARSEASTALLMRACTTMTAATSGSFTTEAEEDSAMMRGHDLPFGKDSLRVKGGWNQEQRWATVGDDALVIRGGRMVVETESGWKLRKESLASGTPAPFVVSPRLLFAQIAELPQSARQVVHLEAGKVQDRDVAILTVRLSGDEARDFALSGALPGGGGPGGMIMIGGMLGGDMPEKKYEVDLALFTAVDSGEVLRLRAKVYEDDPMMANVRIAIAAQGGEDGEAPVEEEEEEEPAVERGKEPIKKGLPDRKPGKGENMTYFRADFSEFGKATGPKVDGNGQRWLSEN